ncbi:hypothetical protein ACHAWO_011029 [Cyclotella atomus]|uniref:Uncharacterized protein n=1 Tax=Cyclotella atomus TaxID=382360 RepID=A0ABD3NRN6_9STRA
MAMYAWKEEQMSNPTNGATSTIPIKPQYKGSLPTAKAELPKVHNPHVQELSLEANATFSLEVG